MRAAPGLAALDWLEAKLPRAVNGALSRATIRFAGVAALVNAVLVVLPIPFGNTAPGVRDAGARARTCRGQCSTVWRAVAATVAALVIDGALVAIAWEAVLALVGLI